MTYYGRSGGHLPVPVAVWPVDVPDAGPSPAARSLPPALAARLVGVYSRPRELVVDFDSDPALAGAAGASARDYRPAGEAAGRTGDAALVVLRWPRPDDGSRFTSPRTALATCRRLMRPDGTAVATVAPAMVATGDVQALLRVGLRTGLSYRQRIIAVVRAPTEPERIQRPATSPSRQDVDVDVLLDLLLFVLGRQPRGERAGGIRPSGP